MVPPGLLQPCVGRLGTLGPAADMAIWHYQAGWGLPTSRGTHQPPTLCTVFTHCAPEVFQIFPSCLDLIPKIFSPSQGMCSGCPALQVSAATSQLPFPASVWANNKHQPLTWGGAKLNALKRSSFWFGFPSLAHLWVPHYFLSLSNGSIKHFKGTLNLWNNLVFMVVYVFVEALQTERAWAALPCPVCSTESWFLPAAAPPQASLCSVQVPQACRSTQVLWTKRQFWQSYIRQKLFLLSVKNECWECGLWFSPAWGQGFQQCSGLASCFPPNGMAGWWWSVNPPEKILLDSKLHLCCSLAALRGNIN